MFRRGSCLGMPGSRWWFLDFLGKTKVGQVKEGSPTKTKTGCFFCASNHYCYSCIEYIALQYNRLQTKPTGGRAGPHRMYISFVFSLVFSSMRLLSFFGDQKSRRLWYLCDVRTPHGLAAERRITGRGRENINPELSP